MIITLLFDGNDIVRGGLKNLLDQAFPEMILLEAKVEAEVNEIYSITHVDLLVMNTQQMEQCNFVTLQHDISTRQSSVLYYGQQDGVTNFQQLDGYSYFVLSPVGETTLEAFRQCYKRMQFPKRYKEAS